MSHKYLLLALVYLDALRNHPCGEIEYYELDWEIEKIMRQLPLGDRLYLTSAICADWKLTNKARAYLRSLINL